jgi:glycosyltransferase involved in cell wall biosynthesis
MKCNICKTELNSLFKSLVMNKHQVSYYKCPKCEFIQTEKPYWLDEAYQNAITDLDVGLVSRNITFAGIIEQVIKNNFDPTKKFLDYAGGYGLFVRLMRDKGFDFYREDKYCENIFAQYHDLNDLHGVKKFEVVTALEVFEHLENPLEEIEKMFDYSDTIIFSTELQPKIEIKSSDDWWYFTPDTGQHVSFYSEKTLKYIAEKFKLSFFTLNNSLHLLSKIKFEGNPLIGGSSTGDGNNSGIRSLIQSDYNLAKKAIIKIGELKKKYENSDGAKKQNEKGHLYELAVIQAELENTELNLRNTQSQLNSTDLELSSTKTELSSTKTVLHATKTELSSTKTVLHATKTELNSTKSQLVSTGAELGRVYSSREWKLILKLQKIVKTVIPVGSARRKMAVQSVRLLKAPLRWARKKRRETSKALKPKKPRKINFKSKKIAYIGHSYHNKTKSTEFLTEYLKSLYDVEIISDESWLGKPFTDLSFIDESYLGVIFFQLLPSKDIFEKIQNNNIIYFPMYDQSGMLERDYWENYQGIKIANFSKTLHDKLAKWGFESMYVQYFPELQKFTPGEKDEVFFWQRLTKINVNTITKLFGKKDLKLHIHKAIDPEQQFVKPSGEDEKKYHITYSDWFETRGEMLDLIKQKGIYVAPREFEGIGHSFLEAMAMGKAVIAVNNPTMNEYIEHGKNGYLFDLKKPKEVDLSNLDQVQKNAYEFMQKGRKKWERDKSKILDFIKKG